MNAPSLKERLAPRIKPEVKGKARAYVFTHYDRGNEYFAGQLFNFIPLFLWSVFYAQVEGIEDVQVVTRNAQVIYVAQAFGFPTLTNEEWETREEEGVDYLVLLHGSLPFHLPGIVREMLRRAEEKGVRYQGTQELGIEVVRMHGGDGVEVTHLPSIYCHRVVDVKWKDVGEVLAHMYGRERNLCPTLIKSIAVVQNQHDWAYDYSSFLDSCDLVMRVNFMDSWFTGRYGDRCDLIICGDSQYFLAQKETIATIFSQFPRIPLIYATQGGLLIRGDAKNGYCLYLDLKAMGMEWTTTLFGLYFLLRAFPGAQMYTTGIESLVRFNRYSIHELLVKGNGKHLWLTLQELGKVIDITDEKEREKYGRKREEGDIIQVKTEKWEDEICLNRTKGLCIRNEWQHLGRLIQVLGQKEGEVAIKWLYDGRVGVYKKGKDGSYEPK